MSRRAVRLSWMMSKRAHRALIFHLIGAAMSGFTPNSLVGRARPEKSRRFSSLMGKVGISESCSSDEEKNFFACSAGNLCWCHPVGGSSSAHTRNFDLDEFRFCPFLLVCGAASLSHCEHSRSGSLSNKFPAFSEHLVQEALRRMTARGERASKRAEEMWMFMSSRPTWRTARRATGKTKFIRRFQPFSILLYLRMRRGRTHNDIKCLSIGL